MGSLKCRWRSFANSPGARNERVAQHGVAADSPPSLSLGPLASLARLAAERSTVRPLTMEGPLVLGRIRLWEVAAAALLMTAALLLAFITIVVVIMIAEHPLSWRISIAVAAFLASLPLRRLGAGLASVLLGIFITTTAFILAAWLRASPEMRAFGPPHPLMVLFVLLLASLGVLVTFRFIPPARPELDQNDGAAA